MRKILSLLLVLIASPALSDCMRDSRGDTYCGHGPCAKNRAGEIYCAPHRDGSAVRNDRGAVVCGLGSCIKDPYGGIYCAIEPGGDALRNNRGEIECFGGCEPATTQLCERIPAGK